MWPFVISGLVAGSVYGLAGVGLVLTYKTSGILNFAHGAIATISAFLFFSLHVKSGMSWPLAAAICVIGVGLVVGFGFERIANKIAPTTLATKVIATIGVLIAIEAAVLLIYPPPEVRVVPTFLAQGNFEISGTVISWSELITFCFALVATVVLYLFFRWSRRGKAMRAVVDSPTLLNLSGTSDVTTRRYAWVIGSSFAAACGVLFSTLLPLDSVVLTLLVLQAFGAAAIGAFTSLPLTFAGGLFIGVLASLCTFWFTEGFLTGLAPSLPFLVLFILLLVLPKRLLAERSATVVARPRSTWSAPMPLQLGGALILLVFLAFVPSFAGIHINDWSIAMAYVVIFLSLGLLVRMSGQVSLGHVAFMAIGAAAFGHFAIDSGLPWLVAIIAAGLIAVPAGILLAIPAMRLSGLYLALATFGFAVLLSYMFYPESYMFGATGASLAQPRPSLSWIDLSSDKGYYYVVLAFAVVTSLTLAGLARSRLGRLLRGMGESPSVLTNSGTVANTSRLLVFCISAFLAAVGGALAGAANQTTSAVEYPPLLSLTLVVLVVIVVGREPWNAVIAGLALIIVPSYISGTNTTNWLNLLFGISAVAMAVGPPMAGPPERIRNAIDKAFGRDRKKRKHHEVESGVEVAPVAPGVLTVSELTVKFGGLVAVNEATFEGPTGRITGLIGPNGAGKTTIFNACSGLVRPSSGKISLDGNNLGRVKPSARVRRGLGRTFQQTQMFESQSVWDNVFMGAEGSMAGVNPVRHIFAGRAQLRAAREATSAALSICGITEMADRPASALSTGQRRVVELARALAGNPRILLLDEPSAGLDRTETARFSETLRKVVAERKIGILLVEHDMSLVMDVCDHIYVLDFGRMLFDGTPAEVRSSKVVQAAYLGDDEAEEGVDDDVAANDMSAVGETL